ncbi:glycerol-3-phosphate acyltransferase [Lysinibacillus sp. LZ02]|uniref:glycerol-3-phosphate acyltransferase n=1 Tax=Lysinibacillus sp. LZ02 TaxID=3420668 RepID=UPI003D364A97
MLLIYYLVISYLIGTLMTAYFVGKWKGINLQQANTGNLGARNAGRTLGKVAFLLTVIGDGLKGVLVVFLGRYLGFEDVWITAGILFVVLGHLYPFWLKFKGGKGIATGIGALLTFSPILLLALIAGFVVSLPFTKSLTISMVIGFMTYSIYIVATGEFELLILVAILALLTFEHRQNLIERVK